jgi:hypothetical protein
VRVTKKALRGFLKGKLSSDDRWALRALMVVYSFQTVEERLQMVTKVENSVGFTGYDAEFLTGLVVQYKGSGSLSSVQLKCLRKMMPKYWKQILEVSDREKLERQYLESIEREVEVEDIEVEDIEVARKEQSEFEFDYNWE